jgi:uncharacterized protein YjgD (DUF1641 family)/tetrahydromethanopterin S-methyltransferase subunit G
MNGNKQLDERLDRIEEKLDRVLALDEKLQVFTQSWENLHDLGRDVSLLIGPSAKLLTEELAEVETGFQLEDSLYLLKRMLLSFRYLAWALEQLENLVDWWNDLEPVLKLAVPHLIDLLDDLEQKGIFRINRAMLNMYAKLAQNYTPEDIEAIGDGFVRMHGLIKKFSDPAFLDFMERFTEIPSRVNLAAAQPVGPFGLMFALMSQEGREGLGVALELTKALGHVKGEAQA